ncbi:hypothetical protein ACFX2H_038567 [Malus domestica]
MGCCYSRVEREEMVSICKSRKRYMKQLVKTRQAWSAAYTMYLCSLRSTGSALLQFLNAETTLHHHHHHLSNYNHHHNYNHRHHNNYQSVTKEEWEATTTISEAVITFTAASMVEPPSVVSGFSKESETTTSELAMMVSRNAKDLVEIIKELDEYFLKDVDVGGMLSLLLEVPRFSYSQTK